MLFADKKIIFFSRDLKIGGMEKALVVLLNRLSNENNNITLVLENKCGELLEQLNPNIKVKEYHISKCKIVILRKVINLLRRFLWSLSNKNRYDFSCNYATYMTFGSKLASIASKNSSLYVHSDYYNFFSGNQESVKNFFLQQGISFLKNIIFVADEAMQPIKKIFPEYSEKLVVIGNLINHEAITVASEEKINENCEHKELILFVGRLEENSKRLSRLIESFKIVCENSSDYELWIVGNGDDYELCEALINKYSLSNRIKLLGQKTNPYPYIKKANCVILTSDFEGFPVIYDECLVLNVPVITTIPTSDNFLDVRNFSVIVKKDSKEIANAILESKYKNMAFDSVDINNINNSRLDSLKDLILNRKCFYE